MTAIGLSLMVAGFFLYRVMEVDINARRWTDAFCLVPFWGGALMLVWVLFSWLWRVFP